MITNSV